MKAYFDKYASLVIEAENDSERAALLLWSESNSMDGCNSKSFFEVIDQVKGLLLHADGMSIFNNSQKMHIDGNANSNAASVTKSDSE
ncbi:hypothetical protein [Pantoea sp. BAV 3049]|uniref:hypothetical protein n=1 Tax=Pantoea sp. BAV 3049 TaxID=2654188 RepID=UPI00131B987D|nr:hypothetical protein [Pantoea sp. BAV 3049]